MERHAIAAVVIVAIVAVASIFTIWSSLPDPYGEGGASSEEVILDEEGNIIGQAVTVAPKLAPVRPLATTTPKPTCNDPDGPENVMVKATVRYGSKSGADSCGGPGTVSEAWCWGGEVLTGVRGRMLSCPPDASVCYEGICHRGCTDLNPCPSGFRCNEHSFCEAAPSGTAPATPPGGLRSYACSEEIPGTTWTDKNNPYIDERLVMRFSAADVRSVHDICVGANVRQYTCGARRGCTAEQMRDPAAACSMSAGTVRSEILHGAEVRYVEETCPFGCQNGICKQYPDRVNSCNDYGGSIRFAVSREGGGLRESDVADGCSSPSAMIDYYCVGNEIRARNKACPSGCRPYGKIVRTPVGQVYTADCR